MACLIFQLKKRADATAQLILRREDGTFTAGSVGPADAYGPVHDLTHYAIEQTLHIADGFLGLCAAGWEISDFEVKGTASRLPIGAAFAEHAAGELSRQLLMRQVSSFEDYLWVIEAGLKSHPGWADAPAIAPEQHEAIITDVRANWERWQVLPPNGTLELTFTTDRDADHPPPTTAERRAGRLTPA